jgi:hypothetical protein
MTATTEYCFHKFSHRKLFIVVHYILPEVLLGFAESIQKNTLNLSMIFPSKLFQFITPYHWIIHCWSEILTASLNNLVIYKYLHYAFWHILTQNGFWNSGFYQTFGSFLDMGCFPFKHSASMSLDSMEPDHNWTHYTIIWSIKDTTGQWEWLKYLSISWNCTAYPT